MDSAIPADKNWQSSPSRWLRANRVAGGEIYLAGDVVCDWAVCWPGGTAQNWKGDHSRKWHPLPHLGSQLCGRPYNWNENSIANKANLCKRCITNGSLLHPAEIACTMASLSHLKWTQFDFHVHFHNPADSTMVSSSLAVIFTDVQVPLTVDPVGTPNGTKSPGAGGI